MRAGFASAIPFCPSSRVALTILFQAVYGGHAGEWGAARVRGRGESEGGRRKGGRNEQGQPRHALTTGA